MKKKPFLIALIIPDFEKLREFATAEGIKPATDKDLMENKEVAKIYEKLLRSISRQLATHEKVRKFLLVAEPFTLENGLMTPTLKIKRKTIIEQYDKEIDALYNELNMVYNTE